MRNDILVRLFFSFAGIARGTERIVEKTPYNVYYIPEILVSFPECKLLFMQRHPLEVYTSYKRRLRTRRQLRKRDGSTKWLHPSIGAFCRQYSMQCHIAMKAANSTGSLMIIRYESLVTEPAETIRRVLSFVGESFESSCIPSDLSSDDTWKEDPHLFGTLNPATKNWRDYIDTSEAQRIEDRLEVLMRAQGYRRYT